MGYVFLKSTYCPNFPHADDLIVLTEPNTESPFGMSVNLVTTRTVFQGNDDKCTTCQCLPADSDSGLEEPTEDELTAPMPDFFQPLNHAIRRRVDSVNSSDSIVPASSASRRSLFKRDYRACNAVYAEPNYLHTMSLLNYNQAMADGTFPLPGSADADPTIHKYLNDVILQTNRKCFSCQGQSSGF